MPLTLKKAISVNVFRERNIRQSSQSRSYANTGGAGSAWLQFLPLSELCFRKRTYFTVKIRFRYVSAIYFNGLIDNAGLSRYANLEIGVIDTSFATVLFLKETFCWEHT
jgi:hypothetical protein